MAVRWRQDSQVYRRYLEQIVILYQNRQDIQMYTEVVLSILAIIVFTIFAIKPTLVTIAELVTQQREKNSTIDVLDQKIENLIAAQTLYETEKPRIEELKLSITNKAEPAEIIRQIEGIAQKNGVSLAQLGFGEIALVGEPIDTPKSKNTEIVVPLPEGAIEMKSSFSVKGTYPQLIAFMKDVELMRRPFYSDNTRIGVNEGEGVVETLLITTGRFSYLEENPEILSQNE